MSYWTQSLDAGDDGCPPLLARLGDEPAPDTSAELYLAVPEKWIPIGDPIIAEIMFTGEWHPIWSHEVAGVIDRMRQRRPDRARYWLVSLDPDAPHAILRSYDDGPLKSFVFGGRQWITVPEHDPLRAVDPSEWDEMLWLEAGLVLRSLESTWYERRVVLEKERDGRRS